MEGTRRRLCGAGEEAVYAAGTNRVLLLAPRDRLRARGRGKGHPLSPSRRFPSPSPPAVHHGRASTGPDIFLVKTYAKLFDKSKMTLFTTLRFLAGAQ